MKHYQVVIDKQEGKWDKGGAERITVAQTIQQIHFDRGSSVLSKTQGTTHSDVTLYTGLSLPLFAAEASPGFYAIHTYSYANEAIKCDS